MATATGLPIVALPHATRQQVFTALFTLLKTTPVPTGQKWKTFTQHLKSYDDFGADAQPAMIMYRAPQIAEQKTFGVTKWHWKVYILVYYRIDSLQCAGKDSFPEQLVDNFIDAIEQVLQTDPLNGRLTLGGLIWHCWIDGQITFDSGLVDNQAVIVIPLSILL